MFFAFFDATAAALGYTSDFGDPDGNNDQGNVGGGFWKSGRG